MLYYNDKNQPVLVRLTVKDFNSFYAKLKKLSMAAKKQESGKIED